jgi:hypothetical protein
VTRLPSNSSANEDSPSIFSILATQARTHTRPELWMTALGGATNVTLLYAQYPRLIWLAAGFAAVTSYGVWGLADGMLDERADRPVPVEVISLLSIRAAVGTIGIGAALFAVAGFMRAMLGTWIS